MVSCGSLAHWLAGSLAGWLAGWLVGYLHTVVAYKRSYLAFLSSIDGISLKG
jgi:hypothetical protein